MLYCKSCKTYVAGIHERCPLCGDQLTGTPEAVPSYPLLPPNQNRIRSFIQLLSIIALGIAIVCITINVLVPTEIWWSFFVVLGLGCGWLWAVIGIVKKENLLNNITWQVVLISSLAFLWDWLTGWRGWSLEYVYPFICTGAMLAVIILSRVLHLPDRDYIIYLIIVVVMGIIPVIFLLTGILQTVLPSIICIAAALLMISELLVFHLKAMRREIFKKLHM